MDSPPETVSDEEHATSNEMRKNKAAAARKRKRERKAHAMAVCADKFPT
jgi:hypothetical protein